MKKRKKEMKRERGLSLQLLPATWVPAAAGHSSPRESAAEPGRPEEQAAEPWGRPVRSARRGCKEERAAGSPLAAGGCCRCCWWSERSGAAQALREVSRDCARAAAPPRAAGSGGGGRRAGRKEASGGPQRGLGRAEGEVCRGVPGGGKGRLPPSAARSRRAGTGRHRGLGRGKGGERTRLTSVLGRREDAVGSGHCLWERAAAPARRDRRVPQGAAPACPREPLPAAGPAPGLCLQSGWEMRRPLRRCPSARLSWP